MSNLYKDKVYTITYSEVLFIFVIMTIELLRQFRVGGYALFDLVLSFFGVFILSPVLSKIFHTVHLEIPRKSWLLFTLPIGILTHIITGNRTRMTKDFLDPQGHFLLKILIIGLLLYGLKGITILKKG